MTNEEMQVLRALETGLDCAEFLADVADYKSEESDLRKREVQQIKDAIEVVKRWETKE